MKKRQAHPRLAVAATILGLLAFGTGAQAAGWENQITIYGWYAGLDGTVQSPIGAESSVELEASDILEDLELVFMGGYEGRTGRWSVIVDAVYMDVGGDGEAATALGTASGDLDISSWLVNAGIGYDLLQSDNGVLGIVGGVRYLSLDVDVDLSLQSASKTNTSDSENLTDGFVGLRGQVMFNDNWFLPYYADIGTGGSDLSYQLYAALGYRFGWGDIRLGYRHLDIEMGDDKLMDSLQVSGPVFGIGFRF